MITARYRSDYAGEFVITETRWSGGKKTQTREWIANPIENHHISGRATCIGTAVDQYKFDYTRLQRHRGGLLGSKKLQTYGTGAVAMTMRLDFTTETNPEILTQLLQKEYQVTNIVYTTARYCIEHPGEFYLIPLRERMHDFATLVYLAAFDGHKEIFLLGYNDEIDGGNTSWFDQVANVFKAYAGTQFYLVGESTRMPDVWADCANVQCMNYRDWIGYCDV
jgi:hypothetical protein